MSLHHLSHQVALAGTITNRETGDVVPGAVVSITDAPAAFCDQLITFVMDYVVIHPPLAAWCQRLSTLSRTENPLKQAQLVLDKLQVFQQQVFQQQVMDRPDRTMAGGDGHYHFLDLPAGHYEITVKFETFNHESGLALRQVHVAATSSRLNFTQLDIPISLGSSLSGQPTLAYPAVDLVMLHEGVLTPARQG